jgi:hypothetical protein
VHDMLDETREKSGAQHKAEHRMPVAKNVNVKTACRMCTPQVQRDAQQGFEHTQQHIPLAQQMLCARKQRDRGSMRPPAPLAHDVSAVDS